VHRAVVDFQHLDLATVRPDVRPHRFKRDVDLEQRIDRGEIVQGQEKSDRLIPQRSVQ